MNLLLIDLLMVHPDQRTSSLLDSIFRLTSNLKFFQDMTEKEESSKLHQECCKVMTVKSFEENQYVFHQGEEADGMYIVLKGTLKTIANISENAQSSEKLQEKTNDILGVGQYFGDLALINDSPRYFSAICLEPTILIVLNKQDYQIIAKAQEKQLNEKVEFLRSLDTFRTWTKVAIQKLSYFFKSLSFKKGKTVYKEGDAPKDVFIVKSGEFIFTQKYLMDIQDPSDDEIFGKLTRRTIKKPFRLKKLNFVIKCKGEIFGYTEIYQKLQGRQFTCTCNSTFGELFVISDKNFAKRVTHPDTLKLIEERCEKSNSEIKMRISKLKITEKMKDQMSYTPTTRIKMLTSEREKTQKIQTSKNFCLSNRFKTPNFIQRIIEANQSKVQNKNIQLNDAHSSMFPTEISERSIKNKVILSNSNVLTKSVRYSLINR